jgi:tetratricopeptide (TPR) repeat protein
MKRVFISYSHKDELWKDRLKPHLGMLEKAGLDIVVWDDRKIDVGDKWYPEIEQAMRDASFAVCLISPDYLNSDFCVKEEIPFLLERNKNQGMEIFPLLIRPCLWEVYPWISETQMLPRDGKSIAEDYDQKWDGVFRELAQKIVKIIQDPHYQPPLPTPKWSPPEKVDISRTPQTEFELFGRKKEIELLSDTWESEQTNIISFVAWGGVGKSTLVNKWLEYLKKDNFRGACKVYAWSFYSQGTSEQVTSADLFIKEALTWFGDAHPAEGSPWDKGKRLADLVRQQKTLLVLDGLEPLQSGLDVEKGKIKDPALSVLVTELARRNNGLCVITTRESVAEIRKYSETCQQVDLDRISAEAGRALLRVRGVQGTDDELERLSSEFGNHALAINLLAEYLRLIPGHHAAEGFKLPKLKKIPEEQGRHARRVMQAFVKEFGDSAEVELLHIMGLFSRPAPMDAIHAVTDPPAISQLTEKLAAFGKAEWNELIATLRQYRLLDREHRHQRQVLDCHPLIREHFSQKLKAKSQDAWQEANSRLYEYYKSLPEKLYGKHLPDTLEEMEPLFAAVAHGCQAEKHYEAEIDVYWNRIDRKTEFYSTSKLGAFGADLAALSYFFEIVWSKPASDLPDHEKANVLSWAGFRLRALGRLREAAQPMQAALELNKEKKEWGRAARNAGNLSELYLTLGEVEAAVSSARQSVDFADRSGEWDQMIWRTALADALHQVGELAQAEDWFREAEAMQGKRQPEYHYLYSLQGFQFCDLLLSKGQVREVLERAKQTLEWAKEAKASLLTHALDKLSLGRAYLQEASDRLESTSKVEQMDSTSEVESLKFGHLFCVKKIMWWPAT